MTKVQMVPIAKISVINPRVRNQARFQEVITNISKVGLKKPIIVSRRGGGEEGFDLVCGQGRLEALAALGQTEVPALVVDVTADDRYLMSLIENLTKPRRPSMELAREVLRLQEKGDDVAEIAAKEGISETYVTQLLRLLKKGEDRLVDAVERGKIPIGVAIKITTAGDADLQRSLTEAYASGKLRGQDLSQARRLIEARRQQGKGLRSGGPNGRTRSSSTADVVRTFKRHTQRQDRMVKRARLCEAQLQFSVSALKDLFKDENFVNLLRAEKLGSLPKFLADEVSP